MNKKTYMRPMAAATHVDTSNAILAASNGVADNGLRIDTGLDGTFSESGASNAAAKGHTFDIWGED